MWKHLRSCLHRWGWGGPRPDKLTLSGQVRYAHDGDVDDHGRVLLSVSVADGTARLHRLDAHGRFRMELPFEHAVRLTIVCQGHLPRVVEVRPLRSLLRFSRRRLHARCEMDVALTPRRDPDGAAARPLMERITMPKDRRPLTVEWDHVVRSVRDDGFVPLFLRGV